MPLDLPINDVKVFVEDALNQLGINCLVDDISTKIMISDISDSATNMAEFTRLAVISKDINVKKGSIITFEDGKTALVYTTPNDDMVSFNMKILLCNATVKVYNSEVTYDDKGDILYATQPYKPEMSCYIERISAREKMLDLGILHEAILKLIINKDADINYEDVVEYKDKSYRIVDIDDIVEGLLIIQLANIVK